MGKICEFWMLNKEEIDKLSQMSEDEFFESDYLDEHPSDCDVDKAWDGLDYLMRCATEGDDFPLGFFHQGTPLGLFVGNWDDDDPGIRWFSVEETIKIANFLDTFSRERLLEHFYPEKMDENNIYPKIWNQFESLLNFAADDYLYENFERLRQLFRAAVDGGFCTMTRFS
jgi:hypothetical protein